MSYKSEQLDTHKELHQRRIQKSFLRYHDPKNWPFLRQTLIELGRNDLIGSGNEQLVPKEDKQPKRGHTEHSQKSGTPFKKAYGGQWDNRAPNKNKKNNNRKPPKTTKR